MAQAASQARDAAVSIVRVLRAAGHVAYLAGGSVRDNLLGLEPKDFDVATDASPDAVCRLFRACRRVGEAFGVVLVRRQGLWTEVATFRTDINYQDGRRPSSVVFTDARHDAQRRDFTINGLFEDPLATDPANRIIDFVGGLDDIRRRRLRAIGIPSQRFAEDYLRMLRAVRFAARLGFSLERRTAAAIRAHAPKLAAISRERIGQELQWTLLGPGALRAVSLLQRLGLDAPVLGEPHHNPRLNVLRKAISHRKHPDNFPAPAPPTDDLDLTYPALLTAWLLDRHWSPWWQRHEKRSQRHQWPGFSAFTDDAEDMVSRWRANLNLTNQQSETMLALVRLLSRTIGWQALSLAQKKRLLAEPRWPLAFRLLRALTQAKLGRPQFMTTRLLAKIRREASACFSQGVAPPPFINGDDLIALGHRPGPALGRLLQELYDAQLEGGLRSRAEALKLARNRS